MEIHIVREGETLPQIAGTYNVSIQEIMRLNDLRDANYLATGQSLIIPVSDGYYTVKAGDTLWKIAQRYKTTVNALVQTNKITNPSLIYPGLILRIPVVTVITLLNPVKPFGRLPKSIIPRFRLWQILIRSATLISFILEPT